jgi:PAS domain S-box-containing protein
VETATTESQYTRSLIEASLDPLVTISAMGKIMDMNNALANITGISRENLIGTDFLDYFTEPQKAREVYQEVFANGFVTASPLTIRHRDGKLTDVLFNGSVYKDNDGNVMGVVIVARDVTEQKRIAAELTEAMVYAELATGIAEEAKLKADKARAIAEDAVKAKQQFLSNMSHEIRTPMNAIIGFTKVVLRTQLTSKQQEYLNAIKTSGDALIVLINDILDLAKVDAGKMVFEQTPFRLERSIAAMLHLFETKIHEKNLRLIRQYDERIPKVLLGDPVRLHQIILNLVSNAVKFTKAGAITVAVSLLSEDEQYAVVEFSVTDTGIGIADEKIAGIFENFQQATSETSRLFGGTGLGLAIVKQLVEAQGGKVSVASKLEKGSSFCFQLSFAKTTEETAPESAAVQVNNELKNVSVLVFEDIALNQLLMRTLLDDFGFKCDIASNGRIGIEKLKTNSYDLILMDLQMPEMNGFEATEYIRKELKLTIPIIALTADVTTADLAKCKAVGMDDYIPKPVDERLLQSKILLFLTRASLLDEHKKSKGAAVEKVTDLTYLVQRTKSDPLLLAEMLSLFVGQTTSLLKEMKVSTVANDWKRLYAVVHKMIPSLSIVGIKPEYIELAKALQENARHEKNTAEIETSVNTLNTLLVRACKELDQELHLIKTPV